MSYPGGRPGSAGQRPVPHLQEPFVFGRPGQAHRAHRVGLNWRTGQGTYPEPNGLYWALSRTDGRTVNIVVWGKPGWPVSNSGLHGSDTLDEFGGVTVSFPINKLDGVRAIVGNTSMHLYGPRPAGTSGADPAMRTWVQNVSGGAAGYHFAEVWAVTVEPLY